MARNAQRTADPAPQDGIAAPMSTDTFGLAATATAVAASTVEHLVHGLVAIANGPDYCLCGATWPCSRREDRDDRP